MADLRKFLSSQDLEEIKSAIARAEARTTASIAVRIEKRSGRDTLTSAKNAFVARGMRNNPEKNSVMFYISAFDRRFAVLGDDGINAMVAHGFWDSVRDAVTQQLGKKEFSLALCGGIGIVGEKLAEHFPAEKREQVRDDSVTFEP